MAETRVQLWDEKYPYIWTCEGEDMHGEPESYMINFCMFCGSILQGGAAEPSNSSS